MNDLTDTIEFANRLPKAELHCHIEGALEAEMLFEMAARNNTKCNYDSVEQLREAYQFSRLQDFLDIYYQGMNALCTERDFYELTRAYLQKAAAQHIRHTEIFFDPQAHTVRGVAFAEVVGGICAALEDAQRELGITSNLIMCFLRHLDERDAFDALQAAEPHRSQLIGVGLDSSERGNPPQKFARVFAEAKRQGYRCVAHAGEEGAAQYIYGALDSLGVARIDHGNAADGDDALIARLVREQIGLTMCPLSNLKLGVIADMREHPLPKLLARGVCVTVNSDDPAYFGGYLNENYRALIEAFSLPRETLVQLAQNSVCASFADDARQRELLDEIDQYANAFDD